MKVNQWTLGIAAAGVIAFATLCSIAGKSDPPAQVVIGQSSQTEIIAQSDTLAEDISPPRVAVAIQNDAVGTIAKTDSSAFTEKEVVVFGPKLAGGVVISSFGTAYYATVAHLHPRVLAIPTAAAVVV
ncbi:MAG: hypothetical protein AAB391_03960 [Patescibacteria group bacterium]